MDGVTPTGSEIKDNYPMVTTSSAGVQTIHRAPASCQRVGMAWREEVCSAVVGVGAPLKDMSGALVLLLWAWRLASARARVAVYIRTPTQTENTGQTTRNVLHTWRSQMSNSSVGSGFGVGHQRAR